MGTMKLIAQFFGILLLGILMVAGQQTPQDQREDLRQHQRDQRQDLRQAQRDVRAAGSTATTNPPKYGMFTSLDGTGNPGTWKAVQGTGTPYTGNVAPAGLFVSTDGTGNPGTWVPCGPSNCFGSGPGGGTFTTNVSVAPTTIPYYASAPASTTIIGTGAGNATMNSQGTVVLGNGAGAALTTPGTQPGQNTIIGYQACPAMTAGRETTCIGYQAGRVFTTDSVAVDDGLFTLVGSFAGTALAAPSAADVLIGQKAGENMVNAANCLGLGTHVADSVQTCTNSTFVGNWAVAATGTFTSTRDFYGGFGVGPLNSSGTSSYNVIIGDAAGNNQVSPVGNVFIGAGVASLGGPVSSGGQVMIGQNAGQHLAGTQYSTGVGAGALQALTIGTGNTAVGLSACASMTTDYDCNGFGMQALQNATGHRNIGIGTVAGSNLTTGIQDIFIGDNAQPAANSDTDEIVIGQTPPTGKGSHTTNIGTTTTTAAFIYGIDAHPTQTVITSATTIAPTAQVFHVSGTTAVVTITAPGACTQTGFACQLTIIPDGAFSTTTGGNIALASTAVVSKALIMTYDPATLKWYPSY